MLGMTAEMSHRASKELNVYVCCISYLFAVCTLQLALLRFLWIRVFCYQVREGIMCLVVTGASKRSVGLHEVVAKGWNKWPPETCTGIHTTEVGLLLQSQRVYTQQWAANDMCLKTNKPLTRGFKIRGTLGSQLIMADLFLLFCFFRNFALP